MNIDQLNTVIELNRSRHFQKTADALFVTQSTISARLNSLERELGCELFKRTSRTVEITPQGQRFLAHAQSIMAIYRRAIQEAASKDHQAPGLAVGGLFILWDILLQDWLEQLHEKFPTLNLVAESHDHAFLLRQLLDGALDLVFIFEPPSFEEVICKRIANMPLIMVSNQTGQLSQSAMNNDYIMVDWGAEFLLEHARLFSKAKPASRRVNQSRLALKFLLSDGGSAYLSKQVVDPMIKSKRLHQVSDAPQLEQQVYAVYLRESSNIEFINQSLAYF